MGNHFCNCSEEYEAYLKAIASTQVELPKPFFWGPTKDGCAMYFLEAGTRRLVRVRVPESIGLGLRSTGLYVNNDKILIAGGLNPFTQKISAAFHVYHVESQKFEVRENLPEPVYGAASCHFLHRFYVLGGMTYGNGDAAILSKCHEYNFAKHRWYVIAPMNIPRAHAQSFVYQNKIWVVGGQSPDGRGNSAEVFEPHLNVWTMVIEQLPFDYWGASLISLEPNRICILGGSSSDGVLRSIHHIDLKKRNIMSKGSLRYARRFPKTVFKTGFRDFTLLGGVEGSAGFGPLPEFMNRHFNKTEMVDLGKHINSFDFDSVSQNVAQVVVKNEDPIYQLRKVSQSEEFAGPRSYKQRTTESSGLKEEMNFVLENDKNTSVEQHDSPVLCEMNGDSITASRESFSVQSLPAQRPPLPQPEAVPEQFNKLYQKFEIGLDRTEASGKTYLTLVSLGNTPSIRISKRNYIFGTDEHPFYLFMDRETFECKIKPIPLDLPLYSEQVAIRIGHFHVLFCGGRSFSSTRSINQTILYNLREKSVKALPKMSVGRFGVSFAIFNGQVWVVGGKRIVGGRPDTLDSIEIFDEASLSWTDHPARLNQKRSHSVCFVLAGTLYCAGGISDTGAPVHSIEKYQPQNKTWTAIGLTLDGIWPGMSVYKYSPDGVIIFGGNKAFKILTKDSEGQRVPELACSESTFEVARSSGTKVADMRIGFVVFDNLHSEFGFHGANTLPEQAGVDEENIIAQLKSGLARVFTHETSLGACSLVRPFKQTHFV